VLIATDVAARGIDVSDITHVINFDAPEDADTYTHRTGRTGRAGATGEAVTFVLGDQAHELRRMAADLGLTREFDSRQGAEHGSSAGGGTRPGGKDGRGGGSGRNRGSRNGNHRNAQGQARKAKQGGGGSTGPKRRRRRPKQGSRSS
jgi:superfamily II DNA/RNA helicase